ncbi:MAG TPA: hypothetical protein VFS38_05325 [Actinomycetota bacterium]|nr:hypothetical protein [Actinomycetota bacterium]
MAIYRPPKARWPLATAAAIGGVLVGLGAGLTFGGGDPAPAASAQAIEAELSSAAGSLEVAAVEYQESVAGGKVIKEAEYEGAQAALASSKSRYADIRPALSSLPVRLEPIDELYAQLESSMESRDDPKVVTSALKELEALLQGEAS